jgi:opacity protein-like surface antigen
MKNTVTRNVTAFAAAAATFAVLAVAPAAQAQDREGRWEFTLGTLYQLSSTIDGQEGSTVDTDNDFGFEIGSAYNFTDNFAANIGLQWSGIGYSATGMEEDGTEFGISGTYDAFTLSTNLVYNFTDNKLTPYIGAGIGWTWIDTNIPNGLPSTGCWWDPWWGYVCSTYYPTKGTDAFSYQATLGLRYTFDSDHTFMKLGWTSQWMDFDNTSGTPRFDVFTLDVGWIF